MKYAVEIKKSNIKIKEHKMTCLYGLNDSGKTTIVNLIRTMHKDISFNKKTTKQDIGVIYENIDNNFHQKYLKLECNINNKKIQTIIDLCIGKEISMLSYQEKWLAALAIVLSSNPKILLIDNSLCNLNYLIREEVIKLLKKLQKQITIVYTTSNIEDSLYFPEIIMLEEKLSGLTKNVLKKECINEKLDGPFIMSLSNKLMFYNLIDKPYFDIEKMVDDIWN